MKQCPFCGVKYSVKQYGEYCPLRDWPCHYSHLLHWRTTGIQTNQANIILAPYLWIDSKGAVWYGN